MWKNFTDAFYLNFISDDRWHYIADGLKTTDHNLLCLHDGHCFRIYRRYDPLYPR